MSQKNVVILGSTGSIGINTLKVIDRYPERFRVIGLTAYNNIALLERQVRKFKPTHVAVGPRGLGRFRGQVNGVKVFDVDHDLEELVSLPEADIIIIGMRGGAALKPFLRAVRCGKRVAPANKEALVMAGHILMREARRHGATVIPIDSEQSAIFQCLQGQDRALLKKILLTASGGALRKVARSRFDRLTVKQILAHPRWKMGRKITVDSAFLMNKGFEVIEALRLFELDISQIEVVIHPEAIIHSMVAFCDGSVIAQLGITDMRLPIQYALSYPERLPTGLKDLNFFDLKQLNFDRPDLKKFPALALCMTAARKGGTLPSVLNAADEIAVEAFLEGRIPFTRIIELVERTLSRHRLVKDPTVEQILEADVWARQETLSGIQRKR